MGDSADAKLMGLRFVIKCNDLVLKLSLLRKHLHLVRLNFVNLQEIGLVRKLSRAHKNVVLETFKHIDPGGTLNPMFYFAISGIHKKHT